MCESLSQATANFNRLYKIYFGGLSPGSFLVQVSECSKN